MLARLSKRSPDDLFVPDHVFEAYRRQILPVMQRVVREVHVPSFTKEDLDSFMLMKLHQMLRRNQLGDRNYMGQCYRAFRNLFADMIRRQDAAWRRGMEADPIDHTSGSYDVKRGGTVTLSYDTLVTFAVSIEEDRV